jgi:hypothetical protein
MTSPIQTTQTFINIEGFDDKYDQDCVTDFLQPYFKDLYKDLCLRSLSSRATKENKLDKAAFL